ncbi:hypothetical protein, conserved [Eimeria necatrix]|uniref:PhoD-like phosphatase metallophosphatase domain-containing protein n=1 Tax=Eimeria necatrix TaxID=51315 RepID=U6MH92_9EIME|nr:hypothetical protein, conserved [Eimeria necatrix]CDJ62438.1 hypothetical protein, conserved [Eimeria necatrix]
MKSRNLYGPVHLSNVKATWGGSTGGVLAVRFVCRLSLLILFNGGVVLSKDVPEALSQEGSSKLAAGAYRAPATFEGEEKWDQSYIFNPSPAFWKPFESFRVSSFPPHDLGHHPREPHRLIFASCNRQPEGLDEEHDLEGRRVWKYISRRKPRAFLWMGDNVYADHMQLPTAKDSRNFLWKLSEGKKPIPPPGLIAAYNSQLANNEYREFLKRVPAVVGTWDDHDMGEDNANKMYSFKYESKEAMLDFLGVSRSEAIRSLEWRGVYSSHQIYLGEDLTVKLIFLDLRFEKDSWWLMDLGDMLGEQQWAWLQQELQMSTADVNVIVSSLQTFANHRLVTETWSHFPWARERLFALLAGSAAKTPIILSGDTHYAEFAAVHCQRLPENWCLNEPEARSFLTAFHNLTTGNPTPLQQLRRLADSDGDELDLKQGQAEGHKTSSGCDPSLQCCIPLHTESPLFRWIPRHLPFFLLALFRVATKPNVFAPRQEWRRPRAPAFSGAFPAPPFVPDEVEQDEWLSEDHSNNTGPRLLYTERNFGELEFIENPLNIVLFPSVDENAASQQDDALQSSGGNSGSTVQLLRVREKNETLRDIHNQRQQKRPLNLHRELTRSLSVKFQDKLQKYKEQRKRLVNELQTKRYERATFLERLMDLSHDFETYTWSALGDNAILFSRLLQLHSALLVSHACEDEGSDGVDINSTRTRNKLFDSCSLLTPWSAVPSVPKSKSLVDSVFRWLWDKIFELDSRRKAYRNSLPFGDAAVLRLSAATDQLARMSAKLRAARLASAAASRRLLPRKIIHTRFLAVKNSHSLTSKESKVMHRLLVHGLFSAASDGLLRRACMQLQSPRRQQQREEINELFHRGVASQPADAGAFADLDADLHLVCTVVDIPAVYRQPSAGKASLSPLEEGISVTNRGARAVADSWMLVELLETKTWILSRTFDAVTGRLAKEKLLSSFASKQRERQGGIGQWTCQGWRGPTESRMYLCHLCILIASLLALGLVSIIIIGIILLACKVVARALAFVRAICRGRSATSSKHTCTVPTGQRVKNSPQHRISMSKMPSVD